MASRRSTETTYRLPGLEEFRLRDDNANLSVAGADIRVPELIVGSIQSRHLNHLHLRNEGMWEFQRNVSRGNPPLDLRLRLPRRWQNQRLDIQTGGELVEVGPMTLSELSITMTSPLGTACLTRVGLEGRGEIRIVGGGKILLDGVIPRGGELTLAQLGGDRITIPQGTTPQSLQLPERAL